MNGEFGFFRREKQVVFPELKLHLRGNLDEI